MGNKMETQNKFDKLKKEIKKRLPKPLRPFFLREARFLAGITKEQKGLEIGPSHHPIAPKKEGYCVETVDWLDQEGLKEHYRNDGVNLDAIEPVDYVWKGGSYHQLIQKDNYYDYIIASHMIEHSTDFAGFFRDCSKLLKNGGLLRLGIPDKRYCFDHYRSVTELAEVLDNAIAPCSLQSVGNVAEYYLNAVTRRGSISWKKPLFSTGSIFMNGRTGDYMFLHDDSMTKEIMRRVQEGEYVDIHHYVFTPASFELLIYDLRILGLIDMEITHMWNTRGNEFIVTLRKEEQKAVYDPRRRRRLLRRRHKQDRS